MSDMFAQDAAAAAPPRTRVLDVAKGVLVGLLHRDPDEAFVELVQASRRHGLSVFHLGTALVATAGGCPTGRDSAAVDAVEQEWGSLLSAEAAVESRV